MIPTASVPLLGTSPKRLRFSGVMAFTRNAVHIRIKKTPAMAN
jgi:hypothetical protein